MKVYCIRNINKKVSMQIFIKVKFAQNFKKYRGEP